MNAEDFQAFVDEKTANFLNQQDGAVRSRLKAIKFAAAYGSSFKNTDLTRKQAATAMYEVTYGSYRKDLGSVVSEYKTKERKRMKKLRADANRSYKNYWRKQLYTREKRERFHIRQTYHKSKRVNGRLRPFVHAPAVDCWPSWKSRTLRQLSEKQW